MASDDQTAMLREAARARGFKLVKSRRRKAGGDFGKYGLTDAKGRECFGFGGKGLTGDAETVLAYLRSGETASWKRSLIGVVGGRKAERDTNAAKPENPTGPVRFERSGEIGDAEKPARTKTQRNRLSTSLETHGEADANAKAAPLTIRFATAKDAKPLAKLLGTSAPTLKTKLAVLTKAKTILVADRGGLVGVVAWGVIQSLDQPTSARITTLFVAPDARREGIGSALLAAMAKPLKTVKIADLELLLDIALNAPTSFLRKTGWTRSANAYRREAN